MAEKVGHQSIYLSGGGVAASSLGVPDLGITSLADVLEDLEPQERKQLHLHLTNRLIGVQLFQP
jgi:hypothetical protein